MSVSRHRMTCGRVRPVLLSVLFVCAPVLALSNATGPNGSNVQALHALGYTGQNVNIGFVSKDNSRADHPAFFDKDQDGNPVFGTGRVVIANPPDVPIKITSHDTQMTGIMVSSGDAAEPNHIGVAPGAMLFNARAFDNIGYNYIAEALEALIVHQGCRAIVTGFMLVSDFDFMQGNSAVSLMYDYYAYHYDVVFANASGNYIAGKYDYHTPPTIPGDAFNGITTGGLIQTGSLGRYNKVGGHCLVGPTVDQRRKPDVVAPASLQRVPTTLNQGEEWTHTVGTTQGFTSWAVPHTAGVAAVLLDYAQTDGRPDADRSEVIKAVMVNATFPNILAKNGDWTDPANITWHTDRGYGRLDALRAYETLSADRIAPGQTVTAPKGWACEAFHHKWSFTHTYRIYGSRNGRLTITTTWHRKVEKTGDTYQAEAPLNVMLEIYDPSDALVYADTDGTDNLRKADVFLDADGVYEIRVYKDRNWFAANETRHYALAFEVIEPLAGDMNNDYVVNGEDLLLFTDCWPIPCDLSVFQTVAEQWLNVDLRYVAP